MLAAFVALAAAVDLSMDACRLFSHRLRRDRGLARAIASTALRHKGQLDAVLDSYLDKKLPKRSGPLREILLSAACQLLFLNIPAHAAIDLAVRYDNVWLEPSSKAMSVPSIPFGPLATHQTVCFMLFAQSR